MLILERDVDERIVIGEPGHEMVITVTSVRNGRKPLPAGKVKLGFDDGGRGIPVVREEVFIRTHHRRPLAKEAPHGS